MHPIYFGSSEKPLFGVYYLPQTHSAQAKGVVLCYPMGQEYMWMHRVYRQMSSLFTRSGFHVLRFDYYGCGDSAGESEEGSIDHWVKDIATAIEEITDAGGLSRVTVIGFRLGATLAALAARGRKDVESLVLWEPVIKGETYLKQLADMHQSWLSNNLPSSNQREQENGTFEVIGFPITSQLRQEIERIDLTSLQERLATRVCVFDSSETADNKNLVTELSSCADTVDYQHIPGSENWSGSGGLP